MVSRTPYMIVLVLSYVLGLLTAFGLQVLLSFF